jgi:5-(carboxyamino)imidazole ribonucleotide mutase
MRDMANDYTTVDGARVGVLMGSASDWPTMERTSKVLTDFGVAHECNVMSAHRNPDRVVAYCQDAETRGLRVLIAAAGGAAHLAGVVSAHTHLPVLGCPMQAWSLDGLDSLLSTVQMPKGIPVATFAIGGAGATNAGLFAISILALEDASLRERLLAFRREQRETVATLPA